MLLNRIVNINLLYDFGFLQPLPCPIDETLFAFKRLKKILMGSLLSALPSHPPQMTCSFSRSVASFRYVVFMCNLMI